MSMKTERKTINMITDSPGRALLLFSLPLILGNLFQQFYNIIDSVVALYFISTSFPGSAAVRFKHNLFPLECI